MTAVFIGQPVDGDLPQPWVERQRPLPQVPVEPPVRFGLPVGDLVAPLYAVIGTLAAVLQADATGRGQHVDVSMLGALTSLVACEPFDAYEKLGLPMRTGATVPRLAPFGTFPAADGWFALCGPTDAFAQVNGAFGVRWFDNKVTTTLKVTNLFDEEIQSHVFGDVIRRQVIGEMRVVF